MKKLVAIAVGLAFASFLSVQAAGTKTPLTPEQKAAKKEMTQKYDTNGDKKLDADEIAKISAEDKEKYEKAGIMPKAHKKK
jgi:hypothetical protein